MADLEVGLWVIEPFLDLNEQGSNSLKMRITMAKELQIKKDVMAPNEIISLSQTVYHSTEGYFGPI